MSKLNVCLDFETGGLDPKRNFPVSLGVAVMEGDTILDQQQWVIQPPRNKAGGIEREYDVAALQISGITWSQILAGKPAKVILAELHEWAKRTGSGDLPVLAYNAPFDFAFYSEMLFKSGSWSNAYHAFRPAISPLLGPWQCVRILAQRKLPDLPDYKLDTVAKAFGLARSSGHHGALEDAILAGTVYHQLCNGWASGAEAVPA